MALIICPECKREISETAHSCPNCGYQLTPEIITEIKEESSSLKEKKRPFCQKWLLICFCFGAIIFFVVTHEASETSRDSSSSKVKENRIFKQGEVVRVGYTSYVVTATGWSTRLNSFAEKPDAMFLMVQMSVCNKDTKARTIPPFYLIDQLGREYEASSKGWAMKGTITSIDSLNPNVIKSGGVIFDVPKNNTYKLKVSGGYWSNENAFIELSPREKY